MRRTGATDRAAAAGGRDTKVVLITAPIADVGIGLSPERRQLRGKFARQEQVVAVEILNKVSEHVQQSLLAGVTRTTGRGMAEQTDDRGMLVNQRLGPAGGVIAGAIIHDDDFLGGVILRQHRGHSFLKQGAAIADRNHGADQIRGVLRLMTQR